MNAHSFIGISGIGLASAPDGLLYLLGGVICFRDYVWHVRSFEEKHEFCPLTYSLRANAHTRTHAHTRAHTQEMLSRKILRKLHVAVVIGVVVGGGGGSSRLLVG
jgi:hypothetical protein